MSEDRAFVTLMRRWGHSDSHAYLLGVWTGEGAQQLAAEAGELEAQWRGGKYEPEVLEVELLRGELPIRRSLDGEEDVDTHPEVRVQTTEDRMREAAFSLLHLAEEQRDRAFSALARRDQAIRGLSQLVRDLIAGEADDAEAWLADLLSPVSPGLPVTALRLFDIVRPGQEDQRLMGVQLGEDGRWQARVLRGRPPQDWNGELIPLGEALEGERDEE